jgi:hypothetical protein
MRKNLVMVTYARILISVLSIFTLLISAGQVLSQDNQPPMNKNQEGVQLLNILRDREIRIREPERFVKAIERLGEIKSVASIQDLVQLLTFRHSIEPERIGDVIVAEHYVSPFNHYPAAGALVSIGKPSVPALTEVIEKEEMGSLASKNAIYAVRLIFRDAPAEGVEQLREAATKAASSQASQQLFQASEKLKRFLQQ